MKKAILILAIALFASCTKDEVISKAKENCNCDKIVEQYSRSIIGSKDNPSGDTFITGTTVNDCTGLNKSFSYQISGQGGSGFQKIGDCKIN
jgi:hypothetical protein